MSIFIISEVYMQYETSKAHVWEKPHTKTAITTPKQIDFTCVHPLDLRIPCKDSKNVFVSSFH